MIKVYVLQNAQLVKASLVIHAHARDLLVSIMVFAMLAPPLMDSPAPMARQLLVSLLME